VAAAAVVALTSCSQNAARPAAHASPVTIIHSVTNSVSPATTHTVSPATCRQQYDAWKNGPADTIVAEVNALDSAVLAEDMSALTATLKKAGPEAVKAARYPIPACADPSGYWFALMMHVNAAANSSGSASSMLSAAKSVPKIDGELRTELNHTTG
jgi:hypothetical protein